MERGPYRFWRVGFGSYVGRVVEGQKPEILFGAGTPYMWHENGIDWGDVLKALKEPTADPVVKTASGRTRGLPALR